MLPNKTGFLFKPLSKSRQREVATLKHEKSTKSLC